jgi:peptidoglycan hydrolase-like protein with peptidoglycan-binding domain
MYYNRAKQVLNKDDAVDASAPAATPAAVPSASPADAGQSPAYPGTPLRQGSRGAGVQTMQQQLVVLGYAIGVDGNFGPGTRSAVMDFQGKKGLTNDGCCGPATWAALWAG